MGLGAISAILIVTILIQLMGNINSKIENIKKFRDRQPMSRDFHCR
jgi:hypothetical protein